MSSVDRLGGLSVQEFFDQNGIEAIKNSLEGFDVLSHLYSVPEGTSLELTESRALSGISKESVEEMVVDFFLKEQVGSQSEIAITEELIKEKKELFSNSLHEKIQGKLESSGKISAEDLTEIFKEVFEEVFPRPLEEEMGEIRLTESQNSGLPDEVDSTVSDKPISPSSSSLNLDEEVDPQELSFDILAQMYNSSREETEVSLEDVKGPHQSQKELLTKGAKKFLEEKGLSIGEREGDLTQQEINSFVEVIEREIVEKLLGETLMTGEDLAGIFEGAFKTGFQYSKMGIPGLKYALTDPNTGQLINYGEMIRTTIQDNFLKIEYSAFLGLFEAKIEEKINATSEGLEIKVNIKAICEDVLHSLSLEANQAPLELTKKLSDPDDDLQSKGPKKSESNSGCATYSGMVLLAICLTALYKIAPYLKVSDQNLQVSLPPSTGSTDLDESSESLGIGMPEVFNGVVEQLAPVEISVDQLQIRSDNEDRIVMVSLIATAIAIGIIMHLNRKK